MNITANQVKELRERTGVGMMECKKALQENSGNMDKAILWLRERGLSRAAAKSGRVASQGVIDVLVSNDKKKAVIVEVNSETDFVSKGDDFRGFVKSLAEASLAAGVRDIDGAKSVKLGTKSAQDTLTEMVARIGENMQIRRFEAVSASNGVIAGYVHGEGKIGTLVVLEGATGANVEALAKDLAMHVAAASPKYLDSASVPAADLEQEKELSRKKMAEEKKPAEMIEKILTGQMQKYFKEICLTEQGFVKTPDVPVKQVIAQVNPSLKLTKFLRFGLGEGVEKKSEDFAEEVAKQLEKH